MKSAIRDTVGRAVGWLVAGIYGLGALAIVAAHPGIVAVGGVAAVILGTYFRVQAAASRRAGADGAFAVILGMMAVCAVGIVGLGAVPGLGPLVQRAVMGVLFILAAGALYGVTANPAR